MTSKRYNKQQVKLIIEKYKKVTVSLDIKVGAWNHSLLKVGIYSESENACACNIIKKNQIKMWKISRTIQRSVKISIYKEYRHVKFKIYNYDNKLKHYDKSGKSC